MTLGITMWVGLMVRQRFSTGPSCSSLMWMSGLMGTGFQLHVGSMVISSYSELGREATGRMVRGSFWLSPWHLWAGLGTSPAWNFGDMPPASVEATELSG